MFIKKKKQKILNIAKKQIHLLHHAETLCNKYIMETKIILVNIYLFNI